MHVIRADQQLELGKLPIESELEHMRMRL
jgi:hypothetical protein